MASTPSGPVPQPTQQPTTPEPGGATARTARTSTRRRRAWLAVLVVMVLVLAALFVRVPYAILSPGPAVNTLGRDDAGRPLVAVALAKGAPAATTPPKTYPTTGSLDFTTVSVRGGPGFPVTAADVLVARLTPHHEVLPADVVFPPDASAEEVKKHNSAEMAGSQEAASVVALRRLGYTVPEKVVVAQVVAGAPADGRLHEDDVLTGVDGVPVTNGGQARAAIRAKKPGQQVRLALTRKGEPVDVTLTTADRSGVSVVGILMRSVFTPPVQVTIRAGDVGGPSAGTMFALAVYDLMTPGDLTGGRRIAGTGTIDTDGSVGAIGGVAEKMVAARNGGAEWFLAPAANCSEVVGHVPEGMRVARMATFDDAVRAVTAIGKGDTATLASCG